MATSYFDILKWDNEFIHFTPNRYENEKIEEIIQLPIAQAFKYIYQSYHKLNNAQFYDSEIGIASKYVFQRLLIKFTEKYNGYVYHPARFIKFIFAQQFIRINFMFRFLNYYDFYIPINCKSWSDTDKFSIFKLITEINNISPQTFNSILVKFGIWKHDLIPQFILLNAQKTINEKTFAETLHKIATLVINCYVRDKTKFVYHFLVNYMKFALAETHANYVVYDNVENPKIVIRQDRVEAILNKKITKEIIAEFNNFFGIKNIPDANTIAARVGALRASTA